MIKGIYKVFLVILLLPLLILNVGAEPIDPNGSGSILGLYMAGTQVLKDLKISVYKVANINSEGKLTYVDKFAPAGYELNGLTSSQLNQLLNNLDKYIDTKSIEATISASTDNEGKVKFNSLSTGFYLIRSEVYSDGNYTYQGKNLITVPVYNQSSNTYIYNVEMAPKIDINKIEKPDDGGNKENDKPNNIPNTYDKIYMYFGIFFVTILGIVMIVYYISKTKRSEEK